LFGHFSALLFFFVLWLDFGFDEGQVVLVLFLEGVRREGGGRREGG
jgi:hypothetical protein